MLDIPIADFFVYTMNIEMPSGGVAVDIRVESKSF
jgi:hypothetical protein